MSAENIKYISLFELQHLVKDRLEASFPLPYWVTAEISEIKHNTSGHCYLELVEKDRNDTLPKAKINAIIWNSTYNMLSAYFVSQTGRTLERGMKILIRVDISYHELYGINFKVIDIEPSYTLGDVQQQKLETINRLTEEGVIDMNKQLELGDVIQNIAIITSETAAGYQDFMDEINSNIYGYKINTQIFQSKMQGDNAEESIINALEAIAEYESEFDAIAIIRGGGSQNDLSCFDSYRLASHVAQFPIPVLSGIGHTKDQSVVDIVAHTSLKTPTATAAFIIEHNMMFESRLNDLYLEMSNNVNRIIADNNNLLYNISLRLQVSCKDSLSRQKEKLTLNELSLKLAGKSFLETSNHKLNSLKSELINLSSIFISKEFNVINVFETKFDTVLPEKIFKLGYARVYKNNKLVKNTKNITAGDNIEIYFADGIIESSVMNKKRF